MELNDYQKRALKTAIYKDISQSIPIYPVLGLCGEVGEIAEKIKKIIRDEDSLLTDENRELLKKELGDVLWYLSVLAFELRLELDDVAQSNLEKLKDRKDRNKLKGSGDNR